MRSARIVRIIMLVAAFTLPLNAQQPHGVTPAFAIEVAQGFDVCAPTPEGY